MDFSSRRKPIAAECVRRRREIAVSGPDYAPTPESANPAGGTPPRRNHSRRWWNTAHGVRRSIVCSQIALPKDNHPADSAVLPTTTEAVATRRTRQLTAFTTSGEVVWRVPPTSVQLLTAQPNPNRPPARSSSWNLRRLRRSWQFARNEPGSHFWSQNDCGRVTDRDPATPNESCLAICQVSNPSTTRPASRPQPVGTRPRHHHIGHDSARRQAQQGIDQLDDVVHL